MSEKIWFAHTGTPHEGNIPHSGRYEWGSGENPYQHGFDFLHEVSVLRAQGLNNTQIAAAMGYSTTEWRAKNADYGARKKEYERAQIRKYHDLDWSNVAIAKKLGISEGKVRGYLKDLEKHDNDVIENTAEILRKSVESKHLIDVGEGVERELGISRTTLNASLARLKEEGYTVNKIQIPQINSPIGAKTTALVLGPEGINARYVYEHEDQIKLINDYHSEDHGLTYGNMKYPKSLDSSRVAFNYANADGTQPKDGVIELRPGVEDISLGNSKYAQVRIMVDDKYYIKGMAMYSNNLPPGVDVLVNTNKKEGAPIEKVLKGCKTEDGKDTIESPNSPIDKNNPFGATIKAGGQRLYLDQNGVQQQSVINKIYEEGDWFAWDKTLASQFLSKQSTSLAEKQLKITYLEKKDEFEEIMSLTQPEVKKAFLKSFSEDCDAAAVDLKAAAMPRQMTQVLLPLPNIKENEVFAPNFKDGEKVCLIRYPHSGSTEIAELKVNNKDRTGVQILGKDAKDCVGVHPKVAEKLSGADFDGDSVVVIPQKGKTIKVDEQLYSLRDFDTKRDYPGYSGMKVMTEKQKGLEMGRAANLITDMTLKGCTPDELADAIKYSMVVIDAHKHKLNWKQAAEDCHIKQLRLKYQGKEDGGAATLVSRAKSPAHVNQRRLYTKIDPETGEKIYTETGKSWVKTKTLKDGTIKEEVVVNKTKSTKMAETDNAFTLLSDPNNPHPMEIIYGTYANQMKALGNQARLEMTRVKTEKVNKTAQVAYAHEVESLNRKLNKSLSNAPHERQAQLVANVQLKALKEANPDLTDSEKKKRGQQALNAARAQLIPNGKRYRIDITPKEYEAIQAGAVSATTLRSIINNTDTDLLREYATPRTRKGLSDSKIASAKAMLASGYYTQAEIAAKFGVSPTTLMRYVNQ